MTHALVAYLHQSATEPVAPNPEKTMVDITGLVDDGLLDLEAVVAGGDWKHVDTAAAYVSCCFGHDGDSPGTVEVCLERTEAYGITAWRWREEGSEDTSDIYLAESDARDSAIDHASDSDETPDVDDEITQILETGFFGTAATAEDIRTICDGLCGHSQGYLLLARGEVPGAPIGRLWTTNGYLQHEHVAVAATHNDVALAAASLRDAVTRYVTS